MEVVLIVTAALAAFLGGSWFFDGPQRRLREVMRVRRRLIGALHEGQRARIVGEVAAIGEPLIAPVTGRRCVLYLVEVDTDPSNPSAERRLVTEQRAVPFVLDDGSGRSVIDTTNGQLSLDDGRRGKAGETHAGMTALLARHHCSYVGARYHERIVEVGAEVAVLGDAVRDPDPDALPAGTYRTDLPARLRMTNVVISNRPAARR